MRQTACARRFLTDIIGGGTPLEGAPMFGMRRRDFVALLSGAAALAARGARAATGDAGDRVPQRRIV